MTVRGNGCNRVNCALREERFYIFRLVNVEYTLEKLTHLAHVTTYSPGPGIDREA